MSGVLWAIGPLEFHQPSRSAFSKAIYSVLLLKIFLPTFLWARSTSLLRFRTFAVPIQACQGAKKMGINASDCYYFTKYYYYYYYTVRIKIRYY